MRGKVKCYLLLLLFSAKDLDKVAEVIVCDAEVSAHKLSKIDEGAIRIQFKSITRSGDPTLNRRFPLLSDFVINNY